MAGIKVNKVSSKSPYGGFSIPNVQNTYKPRRAQSSGNTLARAIALAQLKGQLKQNEALDAQNRDRSILAGLTSQASAADTPMVLSEVSSAPTGITQKFKTQAGEELDLQGKIRAKAAEDATKTAPFLQWLDELDKQYDEAYQSVSETHGMRGAMASAGESFKMMKHENPAMMQLQATIERMKVPLARAGGDVGNFSWSEQQSAGKSLPIIGMNMDMSRAFLPDEYELGKKKIATLKRMFGQKLQEQIRVSQTGEIRGTGYEQNMVGGGRPNNPIVAGASNMNNQRSERLRKLAIAAIQQHGQDPKKVAIQFKQETGEDL